MLKINDNVYKSKEEKPLHSGDFFVANGALYFVGYNNYMSECYLINLSNEGSGHAYTSPADVYEDFCMDEGFQIIDVEISQI